MSYSPGRYLIRMRSWVEKSLLWGQQQQQQQQQQQEGRFSSVISAGKSTASMAMISAKIIICEAGKQKHLVAPKFSTTSLEGKTRTRRRLEVRPNCSRADCQLGTMPSSPCQATSEQTRREEKRERKHRPKKRQTNIKERQERRNKIE